MKLTLERYALIGIIVILSGTLGWFIYQNRKQNKVNVENIKTIVQQVNYNTKAITEIINFLQKK
ncbi:MAG: hypothetical protein L6Q29_03420 [Candidatus Pacebacteria bacterium]|nr:hypothetical protein [Candidatus Paceibacterota bacterium]NUQ57507.1 hypothetical protein [Candidatus Paceibacter sp.]